MRTAWSSSVILLIMTISWAQTIAPVGEKGAYAGFDLIVDGGVIAEVRFCSNGLVTTSRLGEGEDGALVFRDLQARERCGVELAEGGEVTVRPGDEEPFPWMEFDLTVTGFDSKKWEQAVGGQCPFHFLTLSVADAEALHHRGFLVATPRLDEYTMLEGRQGIVASKWSRNWTWAPPFGACPIPVAGLWAPANGNYAAYDFMDARLGDHSEKYIASSYCWEQGESGSFVALVAPYAAEYVGLRYPEPPVRLASHCRILYETDLRYWNDPNRCYHEWMWGAYRDRLPTAPTSNDMSWLPAHGRAYDWPRIPQTHLTYTVPEKDRWESIFFEPGAIVPRLEEGWWTDVYYAFDMEDRIADVKGQLDYILSKVKWFEVNGEQCAYWEKPLEGHGRPNFAGEVRTLRNVHGWGLADVLFAVYEHEPHPEYLRIIDGVLNWTKYNICTRNDISDVPEAMFTKGWGGVRFCLRYWRVFRDDPQRADRAREALELAHSLAYRYTTLFMPDNAEDDNIDGTYLVEPNSGQPWTGMPCANECCQIADGMVRVYVETGDPILLQYLRGMVERWHLLYQDEDAPNTAAAETPFTERWGLFDGCAIGGRDLRADYGTLGNFDRMKPVYPAKARVVCGEKGAMAFCRQGMHTHIGDYRASRALEDGLSFRIVSELRDSFTIDVTAPNYPVVSMAVFRERNGERERLNKGEDYILPRETLWDIEVRDVRDGDRIIVGDPEELADLEPIDITPIKARSGQPREFSEQGFEIVDVVDLCNWRPGFNWDDNDSWAPYTPGCRYAWGVPYWLVPRSVNEGKVAMKNARVPIDGEIEGLGVFLSGITDDTRVEVNWADGGSEAVPLDDTITAWKAWPKWFDAQIELVPYACDRRRVASLSVNGATLWAVTAAVDERGGGKIASVVDRIHEQRRLAKLREQQRRERTRRLQTGHALYMTVEVPQACDHCYAYVYFKRGEYTIPADAFLEYNVMIPDHSVRDNAGVDLTGGTLGNLRDRVTPTHPSRPVGTFGEWVHEKFDLASVAGETFEYAVVATDSSAAAGTFRGYFRDIAITDGEGNVLIPLYGSGPELPVEEPGISPNGGIREMEDPELRVVEAGAVETGEAEEAFVLEDGVARDDFSGYPDGASGRPNWQIKSGSWVVRDGRYVGTDCVPEGWVALGAGAGDVNWGDYRLSVRFRIAERGSDWRDGAWIAFRCTAQQRSGYSLNCHDRSICLHKHYVGRGTNDSNPMGEAPWEPDNDWHDLQIQVVGPRITVTLDGDEIIDVTDEGAAGVSPIPAGNIVLCARRWEGSEGHTIVEYDDVVVRLMDD